MKRCPKCNRKYEDNTLKICLEDGTALPKETRDSRPPATEILPPRVQPTIKPNAGSTVPSYPDVPEFRSSQSDLRHANPILTAGVVAIALLLLALVGIAAYFVLRQSSASESAKINPSDPARRGSSPTVREGPSAPNTNDQTSPEPPNTTPIKITPSASSVRLAVQANTYYAANAMDGKRSTAWIEGVDGPGIGEWLRFDFDREINLHRILILPGYFKSPQIWTENNRVATLTAYFSDGTSRDLTFDDRMDSQKIDIGSKKTRWVKLVIKSVYYGTDPDTAISEVAFEWD
jgi:hypothetical protein